MNSLYIKLSREGRMNHVLIPFLLWFQPSPSNQIIRWHEVSQNVINVVHIMGTVLILFLRKPIGGTADLSLPNANVKSFACIDKHHNETSTDMVPFLSNLRIKKGLDDRGGVLHLQATLCYTPNGQ